MCLLQCCYSCHLKVILDRMVTSCCLQQDPGQQREGLAGAEAGRQLTLEEMLYPPASWETEAAAATPLRRGSPKVCPVNLADLFSDDDEEEEAGSGRGGAGYSPPGVNDSVSVSVSVVSRASLRSVSRRVSFRSPDESDVFIIPARSPSDDGGEWSSDGE